MTDSKAVHYKSNFLVAVCDRVYENNTPLPMVMNLLETFDDNSTALHYCAKNGYFITFKKILNCDHPAVGLLIGSKNADNCTALDFLLQNNNLTTEEFDLFLEKMKSKSLSGPFSEILEASLERIQSSLDYHYNKDLKPSLDACYAKITQEILMKYNQTYTPNYDPTEIISASGFSLNHEIMTNRRRIHL